MAELKKSEKKAEIKYAEHVTVIEPGTQEMELLLQAGYDMTIDEAKQILREYKENILAHDRQTVKNAKAVLAAFTSKASVTSTTPAWKRGPTPRNK